jgi:hypothetical protein
VFILSIVGISTTMEDLSKESASPAALPDIKITEAPAPLVLDTFNLQKYVPFMPGTGGQDHRAPSIDPIIEARVLRKFDARVPVLAGFLCIAPSLILLLHVRDELRNFPDLLAFLDRSNIG